MDRCSRRVAVTLIGPLVMALAAPGWAAPTAAPAATPLRDGDRIVFLGDSITAQHLYTRYIELYVRLRFPALNLTFTNAGIGGHTARDGARRLDTDVYPYQPTVLFVNFGMNDAFAPPGSEGAAFDRWMKTLLDEVATHREIRTVVWLDPTPVYEAGLPAHHPKRFNAARLRAHAEFAAREGRKRGLTVVPWHRTLTEAFARFRRFGGGKTLIPGRIHPTPTAHVLMALEALRAMGYDLAESGIKGEWSNGMLRVEGTGLSTKTQPWDGRARVTVDLADLTPPVPLGLEFDPKVAAPPEVARLGRVGLKVGGLPAAAYRVEVDDAEVGRFTSRELAAGIDLMGGARARSVPRRSAKAQDASCEESSGFPFLDDYYCLADLCHAKDRIRNALRSDHIRALPAFVPGYLDRYRSLLMEWLDAANRAIAKQAERTQRHRLSLSAAP